MGGEEGEPAEGPAEEPEPEPEPEPELEPAEEAGEEGEGVAGVEELSPLAVGL